MKIISKINSITSLNDKNLEKFACNIGNFGNSTNTTNNNNNTRFMNAKSFIDFIPSSSNQIDKDLQQQQQHKVDGFGILDAQPPLSSAKSLKFNNGDSNSIFWDSFKIPAVPAKSTSNLRNTVSSSNLAIGYTDNQQTQPKFYNFNPQQQHQQQPQQQQSAVTKSAQDEQLAIMRKNSLPQQNTSSCNYNNNLSENDNMKNNNNKDLKCNDLNVNSLKNNSSSSSSSSKMTSSNELQQKQLQHQQLHQQQQQQQQQNSSQNEPIKPSQTKWPIVATPHQVMLLYMNKLTPFEHHEIYKYSQIYFIGANAKKRSGIGPNNSDYDNESGSYIHIPHDHVAYRYEVLKVIGKGSFGQVVKAYDHKTREHVALKMVRNEKRFHRQAQEEIRILQHLRKQDKDNTMNIIHMYDYFVFRNHMCITFELLHINLYELIKKNKFQGFSLQLVRKFAHSLLQCLDALSKFKIIHCDMKPENILLKQQGRSGIKVS